MGTKVPSENMLKLRELTEKMNTTTDKNEYKEIVRKLQNMVESGKKTIEDATTPQKKIKCYEIMCSTITEILKSVKLI